MEHPLQSHRGPCMGPPLTTSPPTGSRVARERPQLLAGLPGSRRTLPVGREAGPGTPRPFTSAASAPSSWRTVRRTRPITSEVDASAGCSSLWSRPVSASSRTWTCPRCLTPCTSPCPSPPTSMRPRWGCRLPYIAVAGAETTRGVRGTTPGNSDIGEASAAVFRPPVPYTPQAERRPAMRGLPPGRALPLPLVPPPRARSLDGGR